MRYYHLFFAFLLLGKVSLSSQEKIPKLVVPPGNTFQLESNFLQIDTLIMHPNSSLSLAQGDNILVIGHATIGRRTKIIGRGIDGLNGSNGRSGEPAVRLPGIRDGGRGGNGNEGGAAPNLKLYLEGINRGGRLSITLKGGSGGKGGDGGEGGTKEIDCRDPDVSGTNGGIPGMGGFGGVGGELLLLLGEGISQRAIVYKSTFGEAGEHGRGGKAGLLLRKCGSNITRTRPGVPGTGVSFYVETGGPVTNPDFLEFPSPVPKPSASTEVPIKVPEGSSFGMVETKLRSALKECGYDNLKYRRYKDGFAIFTGMEHITSEGIPLANDRFSPEQVKFYNDPSFISFLKSLFKASTGYSRIIVFIVSAESLNTTGGGVARSEAITWLQSGNDELPQEIANRPFTSEHKVKALIYEFSKRENDSDPVFSEPSLIGIADKHLEGTSLLSLLTRE